MNNYIGEECPVCKNKFNKDDNIVVCPECGTPYHKECYKNEGKCLFEDKHYENYSWIPSENKNNDINEGDLIKKKCPHCGQENRKDSLFCDKCGIPFNDVNINNTRNIYAAFEKIPFIMDPLGGINENESIKGVAAKDIAKFVQNNTPYYLNVFKKIKDLNVGKFSVCGFLFSGGWLLYRKQYRLGTILTSIVAICIILNTFISYNYSQPILKSILNAANIDATTASMITISDVLSKNFHLLQPIQMIWIIMPLILSLIKWSIMLLIGFRGNRIYFNHTIKKINYIKNNSISDQDYNNNLNKSGGVNIQIGVCLLICYMLIQWLPQFLI